MYDTCVNTFKSCDNVCTAIQAQCGISCLPLPYYSSHAFELNHSIHPSLHIMHAAVMIQIVYSPLVAMYVPAFLSTQIP